MTTRSKRLTACLLAITLATAPTASQITHSLLARQINPETWSAQHRSTIDRLHRMLSTLATQAADLAPVSVALRELRHLA